jgi:NAD-dependent deacetylase
MQIDLAAYSNIVVLTGAGISAASGLRTYRGPDGVWEEYEVERYGHADALARRPEETWKLYGGMRAPVLRAAPNAAHKALARWEQQLAPSQSFLIVTQNVDSLHGRAGSRNVVELHGNLMFTRCSDAACSFERFRDEDTHAMKVPTCPVCGAVLRPDVVLFGEEIPSQASWTVKRALRDCDLFVAVGTSGLVSPASNYVRGAAYAGARTIFVNLEPLAHANPAFKEQVLGPAEEVLPRLLGIESDAATVADGDR